MEYQKILSHESRYSFSKQYDMSGASVIGGVHNNRDKKNDLHIYFSSEIDIEMTKIIN